MTIQPPTVGAPPRFLADVNFNWRIVSGLRRRLPAFDCVTAQELGLHEEPDEQLLRSAQSLNRILLTHDVNTMPHHFAALLGALPASEQSPGVMLVAQNTPIGIAIQAVVEVWTCSAHGEWRNQIVFLPL